MTNYNAGGRVPPYNQEAETAIIGAILLNNQAFRKVSSMISPESFYLESNRRVFSAIIDLFNKAEPVDHVTLGGELIKKGDLEKIGGAMALDGYTRAVASIGNIEHYARIVEDSHTLRKMIYAASQIEAEGFSHSGDVSEFMASARKLINDIANSYKDRGNGPALIDAELDIVCAEILDGNKEPAGIVKTGHRTLDRVTGGLWPGLLTVIAGRPGMGKSAFVLNLAVNAALSGKKVLYITLEDTRRFVVYRMLSRFANIDLTDLTLGRLKEAEQFRNVLDARTNIYGKLPLWIEDSSGLTTQDIARIAHKHYDQHGLDLLVVDHLGEVADKGENETSITTNAARNIRDIAKGLNIAGVLCCQLNRGVEQRTDKRPHLADLRQSGSIEAIARSVWFLYRPGYYNGNENRPDMHLIVAKSNHGRTGLVKMYANLSRMFVRSWDEQFDGLWPQENDDYKPLSTMREPQDFFRSANTNNWQDTKEKEY